MRMPARQRLYHAPLSNIDRAYLAWRTRTEQARTAMGRLRLRMRRRVHVWRYRLRGWWAVVRAWLARLWAWVVKGMGTQGER